MKFAFQIDPIEELNLEVDTSWRFMNESKKFGSTFFYTPKDLFCLNNTIYAQVSEIQIFEHSYIVKDKFTVNLEEMDVIFFRQNPPYDMNYLTTCYMLERIEDKVLIINSPKAIRSFPEKISPLNYSKHIPPTLFTSKIETAHEFMKEHGKIILKPLYSFAGNDIFVCANYDELLKCYNYLHNKYNNPVIAQRYIENITKGDKRILLANGEILGAYNRLPKENSFLANTAQGGNSEVTELTDVDLEICNTLKKNLIRNKIFFAGIDVIDGMLTEINITSPTGIATLEFLYKQSFANIAFKRFLSNLKK